MCSEPLYDTKVNTTNVNSHLNSGSHHGRLITTKTIEKERRKVGSLNSLKTKKEKSIKESVKRNGLAVYVSNNHSYKVCSSSVSIKD